MGFAERVSAVEPPLARPESRVPDVWAEGDRVVIDFPSGPVSLSVAGAVRTESWHRALAARVRAAVDEAAAESARDEADGYAVAGGGGE